MHDANVGGRALRRCDKYRAEWRCECIPPVRTSVQERALSATNFTLTPPDVATRWTQGVLCTEHIINLQLMTASCRRGHSPMATELTGCMRRIASSSISSTAASMIARKAASKPCWTVLGNSLEARLLRVLSEITSASYSRRTDDRDTPLHLRLSSSVS